MTPSRESSPPQVQSQESTNQDWWRASFDVPDDEENVLVERDQAVMPLSRGDTESRAIFEEESPPQNDQDLEQPQEEVIASLVDLDEENRKQRALIEKEVQEKLEQKEAEIQQTAMVAEQITTGFWCSRRTKIIIALATALAIIFAILGTSLWLVLKPVPPPAPIVALKEFLSSVALDGGESLGIESSPQHEALVWLANNTNLTYYSNVTKIQRYALAALYFATNGSDWVSNGGWLSEEDECTWDKCACSSNNMIQELYLNYNNMHGSIPVQEMVMLESLGTSSVSASVASSLIEQVLTASMFRFSQQLSLILWTTG